MSHFSKLSKTERIQFWLDQLNQQACSGQTIREFCDQQRISVASFYQWKRRLAPAAAEVRPDRITKPSSSKMTRSTSSRENRHPFTELIVSDSGLPAAATAAFSGWQASATLPGGVTINFGSHPEVIALIVDRLVWQSQAMESNSDQPMKVDAHVRSARKAKR